MGHSIIWRSARDSLPRAEVAVDSLLPLGTWVAVSVPSTVPPFRAAYSQLCHFTGTRQENKVSKAEVIPEPTTSFLSCGPAPSAGVPRLWCYLAQKLALYTLIVKTRVSSTAGISLSRGWRGIQGSLCPSHCVINLFLFFWWGTGHQAWIPTFKSHWSALCRWGPEAVGGAVMLLYVSACSLSLLGKVEESKATRERNSNNPLKNGALLGYTNNCETPWLCVVAAYMSTASWLKEQAAHASESPMVAEAHLALISTSKEINKPGVTI